MSSSKHSVLVVGDSLAQTLCPIIKEAHTQRKAKSSTYVISQPGCQIFSKSSPHSVCEYDAMYIISKVKQIMPSVVILHYDWVSLCRHRSDETLIREFLSDLKKQNISVIVLGPPPQGKYFNPKHMLQRYVFSDHKISRDPVARSKAGKWVEATDAWISGLSAEFGFLYLSVLDLFCSDQVCSVVLENGTPLFTDGLHLRPAAALEKYVFLTKYL